MLAQASAENAEDLVDGIETLRDAVSDPATDLKPAMNALAGLIYYLET